MDKKREVSVYYCGNIKRKRKNGRQGNRTQDYTSSEPHKHSAILLNY